MATLLHNQKQMACPRCGKQVTATLNYQDYRMTAHPGHAWTIPHHDSAGWASCSGSLQRMRPGA